MALDKSTLFNKRQKRTADLANALGHPARIAILQILSNRDTCVCGDISGQLPLAQSTVSQHLKVLKDAGIIQGKIDGVRTCYCLDPNGVQELQDQLSTVIDSLNPKRKDKAN